MKKYKVKISSDAKADIDDILAYLRDTFKSPQAVRSVWQDYMDTRRTLEQTAGIKPLPDSQKLRERGLKRIDFKRHDYFMLFRIVGDSAYVVNVFHTLEDFESKLR